MLPSNSISYTSVQPKDVAIWFKEMVLSRGMIGEEQMQAKVACPLHKNTFSLKTGKNLNGTLDPIATYPVKIEDGYVYIGFSKEQ